MRRIKIYQKNQMEKRLDLDVWLGGEWGVCKVCCVRTMQDGDV